LYKTIIRKEVIIVNLIDSKVIQTELEKEIFIDQSSNIELTNFRYPDKNFPFYEVMISIGMLRIRNNEYYGTKKELFGLSQKINNLSLSLRLINKIFSP
jgi:hypothetical protein